MSIGDPDLDKVNGTNIPHGILAKKRILKGHANIEAPSKTSIKSVQNSMAIKSCVKRPVVVKDLNFQKNQKFTLNREPIFFTKNIRNSLVNLFKESVCTASLRTEDKDFGCYLFQDFHLLSEEFSKRRLRLKTGVNYCDLQRIAVKSKENSQSKRTLKKGPPKNSILTPVSKLTENFSSNLEIQPTILFTDDKLSKDNEKSEAIDKNAGSVIPKKPGAKQKINTELFDGIESTFSNPKSSYLAQFSKPYIYFGDEKERSDSPICKKEKNMFFDGCIYCQETNYYNLLRGLAKQVGEACGNCSNITIYREQTASRFGNLFFIPFSFAAREWYRFGLPHFTISEFLNYFIECRCCKEPIHIGCILDSLNSKNASTFHKVNLPVEIPRYDYFGIKQNLVILYSELQSVFDGRLFPKETPSISIFKKYLQERSGKLDFSHFAVDFPLATLSFNRFTCRSCSSSVVEESSSEMIPCSRCFVTHSKNRIMPNHLAEIPQNPSEVFLLTGSFTTQQRFINHSPERPNKGVTWVCQECLYCSFFHSEDARGSNWTKNLSRIWKNEWHSILLDMPTKDQTRYTHHSELATTCATKDATDHVLSDPENLDFPQLDFLFCDECYQEYIDDHICSVCSTLFSMDDNTTPMLTCCSCEAWIHTACDPTMDHNKYELEGRKAELKGLDSRYFCPVCRYSFLQQFLDDENRKESYVDPKYINIMPSIDSFEISPGVQGNFSDQQIIEHADFVIRAHSRSEQLLREQLLKLIRSLPLELTFQNLLIDRILKITMDSIFSEGNFYLLNLGDIRPQGLHHFVKSPQRAAFPLDYAAVRWSWSYKVPSRRTLYFVSVTKRRQPTNLSDKILFIGDPAKHEQYRWIKPCFIMAALDDPLNPIICEDLVEWPQLFKSKFPPSFVLQENLSGSSTESFFLSSTSCSFVPTFFSAESFFGVTLPTIRRQIELLPGLFSYPQYTYSNSSRIDMYKLLINKFKERLSNSTETTNTTNVGDCFRFLIPEFPRKCPTDHDPALLEHYTTFSLATLLYARTQLFEDQFDCSADSSDVFPSFIDCENTSQGADRDFLSQGYDRPRYEAFREHFQNKKNRLATLKTVTLLPNINFKSSLAYNSHVANVYIKNRKENVESLHCGYDLRYLAILRSGIQGYGIFALQPIPENTVIIEYIGEIITPALAHDRERDFYEAAGIGTYIFTFEKYGGMIDATLIGNAARYINHCCEPNCHTLEIEVESKKVVLIISKKPISILEELTYDYRFNPELNDAARIPCHCSATKCRGFMN